MIRFACPGCSATFTVADEKAGKTGQCPKCQAQFVIPNTPEPSSAGGDAPPPLPSSYTSPPPPPPPADPNAPVEIRPCPKCGARASVMPADVGMDIACPSCENVYRATRADAPPPPSGGSRSSSSKLVKLGSGSDRDDEDDRPSRRRRRNDDEDEDRPSRRRRSRYDDDDDDDDDRPRGRSRRGYRDTWTEPHRGAMLLVFSILGFAFCQIFAIVAWVMAANDLREMDAGRMDPEGRGLTQAAKVISMIVCILTLLVLVGYCFIFAIAVGAGAAN